MDENNRQNRKSTGMRTAMRERDQASGKYSGSVSVSPNRNRTIPDNGSYRDSVKRNPADRNFERMNNSPSERSRNSNPGERKPLTKQQRLQRQKRKKQQRIKAIAMLVVVVLVIIGIIIGIVSIVNGAKNGKNDKTTTPPMETTIEVVTDANGETLAGGETTTETETTTSGIVLADNDGSSIVKPANWNGKTVYLTFDDGPSAVTSANLDVLDEYGVKATFFCLGFASAGAYQEIVNRGHTLAAHSYSHDYDTIYANLDSFANDVQQIKKVLEDATGTEVFLYRFPGGSNNLVHDCPSMTELANYIESIGMKYMDWNADSTDAEYTTADVDVLIAHSLADIEYWGDETDQDTIVLLMHDSENKTTGTACLSYIIPYLLEKGYAFDRISRDTPDIHFIMPD